MVNRYLKNIYNIEFHVLVCNYNQQKLEFPAMGTLYRAEGRK